MAIDSCDHSDYIVVYDKQERINVGCPACELIFEVAKAKMEAEHLSAEVDDLKSQID